VIGFAAPLQATVTAATGAGYLNGSIKMPTYDFKCERCGKEYSILRSMNESSEPYKCNNCHVNCTRVVFTPEFILKGSGWPGKTIKEKGRNGHKKT